MALRGERARGKARGQAALTHAAIRGAGMTALLMLNPLALLVNLVEALVNRLAPQPKPRAGPPPRGEVLAFERGRGRARPSARRRSGERERPARA